MKFTKYVQKKIVKLFEYKYHRVQVCRSLRPSHIGRNVQSDVVESNTQSDIDQEDAILRAFFLDDEISQTHVEESVPFNPEQSTISEALQSDIEISVMSSPGAPTIPSLMSLPFSESDLEWNIGYCSGKRTRRIGIDKGKTQFLLRYLDSKGVPYKNSM